jgi:hypothetical protein
MTGCGIGGGTGGLRWGLMAEQRLGMKCGGDIRDGSGRPARSRAAAVGDLEGGGSDLIFGQVPASVFHREGGLTGLSTKWQ